MFESQRETLLAALFRIYQQLYLVEECNDEDEMHFYWDPEKEFDTPEDVLETIKQILIQPFGQFLEWREMDEAEEQYGTASDAVIRPVIAEPRSSLDNPYRFTWGAVHDPLE